MLLKDLSLSLFVFFFFSCSVLSPFWGGGGEVCYLMLRFFLSFLFFFCLEGATTLRSGIERAYIGSTGRLVLGAFWDRGHGRSLARCGRGVDR